ncbi:hypothetical protein [Aliidiomarina quisquiliarum]|uniref:hypothetical protein n=1 Tax=Aliidiomarina quisquiliarum TaxID=2938947 RepID=UPI00208EC4AC|nr:hypothetical protein [Aliidiomarina quisquiliarum]MCO4321501.1 hypothetical protein [Aliidiomarina quisquiliarum]
MDSISRDVGVARPPISTSHGQLSNNEKQSGAETEQNAVRKEQRMVNELAQQKVSAQNTTNTPAEVTEVQPAIAKSTASTSQQSNRAPNWSQLSAQVNGYTQIQRAMNLYQRINNLG